MFLGLCAPAAGENRIRPPDAVQKTMDDSAERARNAVAAEERGDPVAPADAPPHADTAGRGDAATRGDTSP
jgi:hypothetical protein